MKKLIALSLALSSLVIAGNAMALPRTVNFVADFSNKAHTATCYLIANIEGVGGSCDYECDIRGQLNQSPTLTVFLREKKVFRHTQCGENEGRLIHTYLASTNDYDENRLFDQWDREAKLDFYAGSEESGMAVFEGAFIAVGFALYC